MLGKETILSCTGLHQGDSLASTLHSFAALPVVKKIDSEVPGLKVNVWFQDDGNQVGNASDLGKVVEILRLDGPELGLCLSEGPDGKSCVWRAESPLPPQPAIPGISNNCSNGLKVVRNNKVVMLSSKTIWNVKLGKLYSRIVFSS